VTGLPIRPELRGESPYGAPELDVPVRLNVNENPYPPPPDVQADMVRAVADVAGRLNRYPNRDAVALRTALAAYLGHGLTYPQVWAANGSNEVMIQILQAFGGPGRSVLTFTPSYSMYPEYARDTHTAYLTAPRTPDFRIDPDVARLAILAKHPDVVVIANPNNPTGTPTPLTTIEAILAVSPGMVVVDEAYQEFSAEPSALALLPDHPRLIVTRTMSKAFAFAGGRLGYAAAGAAVIDALRIVRLPYHLSATTQALAEVALAHADEMLAQVAALVALRDVTAGRLRALGYTVVDSQANFMLVGPFADRHATWQRLVDHGVLVRETGPEPYLRVSIGTPAEMEQFLAALGPRANERTPL